MGSFYQKLQQKSIGDLTPCRQPPERCHQLSGDRDEQFAVVINDQWRLVFVPKYESIPRKEDGGIELSQITTIEVILIGDYHE